MRLRNIIDRKSIAVIMMLFIILFSIKDPIPEFSTLLNQQLNLKKADDYQCLAGGIPKDVSIIFSGNPYNPSANTNLIALYYRAQYFLAPRLLHLINITTETPEQDDFEWFIVTNLEPEQIDQLNAEYQLSLQKACGPLFLFQQD